MSDDDLDAADDALLRAATDELARSTRPEPPRLLDSVMRTVGAELRPSRRLRLDESCWATESAVATAVRTVLDEDPAVVARRVRVEPAGPAVRIWLSVAVSYAHYTRHGDELVRRRVADAARDLFGLQVEGVDLDVVDVFDTRPGGDR